MLKLLNTKVLENKKEVFELKKCISFKIRIAANKNILDSFVVNCDNCLEIEKVTKKCSSQPLPVFFWTFIIRWREKIVLLDCQTLNICQLYIIRPSVKIIQIHWCKKFNLFFVCSFSISKHVKGKTRNLGKISKKLFFKKR